MSKPDPQLSESPSIVRVLKGEESKRPPFWFMRQAGRYLPEYRELRKDAGGFLRMCYTPKLAAEVTMQPIRRYGMDAAILFSDILVVPDALGWPVWFEEGEGPRLNPLNLEEDLPSLSMSGFEKHLEPVYETVGMLRSDLPAETALIGFSGMPWTLATYMVEGKSSKEWQTTRIVARRNPTAFKSLIDLLVEAVTQHLSSQVRAGAQMVQLFDSWAGVLPPSELERWSIEPCIRIVRNIRELYPEVPIVAFPRGIGLNVTEFVERTGVDGLSLDTSAPPELAASLFCRHNSACLQGNLDPVALAVGGDEMIKEAESIVESWRDRRFIFNLGHGVLPMTDPASMEKLCRYLHSVRV